MDLDVNKPGFFEWDDKRKSKWLTEKQETEKFVVSAKLHIFKCNTGLLKSLVTIKESPVVFYRNANKNEFKAAPSVKLISKLLV